MAKKAAKKAPKKAAKTVAKKTTKKAESPEQKSKHMGEVVKKGDLVLVDVLARLKNGRAYYATNVKDAVKENIFDDKKQYTPDLVIVGERGFLLDALSEELESGDWKVGDEKSFDLPPEKAFGKREGAKLRQITGREFKKRTGKVPQVGLEYQDPKSRETGVVRRVGQGRVIVDYNHPLAGKEVTYILNVVDKVTEENEIIRAFLSKNSPPGLDINQLKIEKKGKDLEIELPQALMFQNLVMFKLYSGNDLTRYVEGIDCVKFIEVFEKIPTPDHDHDHDHNHDHAENDKGDEGNKTDKEVESDNSPEGK